jgi:hypothetical protein
MIDFSTAITDLGGKPAKDEGGNDATLRDVAVKALLVILPEGPGAPQVKPDERAKRGWLAQKIHDAQEPLELKAEQVALLKDLIGKLYPPLTVMRAWAILDPATEPKE